MRKHAMYRKRTQRGISLIEVMMVMVIIFLLAAIAVPIYSRMMLKAERTALASEATTVHQAFLAYYADHGQFPPAFFGDDRLNLATLAPLTTDGYLSPQVAESFIRKQNGGQIDFYWSLWIDGQDREIMMILRPAYDPDELVYIFHTQILWGSQWHDGVYFFVPGAGYKKIDELKNQ